ncbi:MAG: dTDP-4-dehydrorhamnose reductase [Bacilli bacterium]|nr:dTDP-4-dehydrorhamnose reductase [Bacilli bacterium]MBR2997546.1 dTDP-4-dehydrorhamnose reductase [Bacilli bacterium]
MKVLVTGSGGQLGYDVVRELQKRGYTYIYAPKKEELDLTNKKSVYKYFEEVKPDAVIHCAAYTAVDNAEDDEKNAIKINIEATSYISDNCKKYNSKLVYISTDYVFDGNKPLNEVYEVDDGTNPQSVYGKSKLQGEKQALYNPHTFVVRTSWVFGINGKNFVKTMLNLAETRNEINVVSDQWGSPTYTVDLSRLLVDMIETNKYGIYHANNEGYCNWAEFAEEIFNSNGINMKVNHITSEEYPQKAKRPKNSKLSKKSLINAGFKLLPDWKNALNRYNKELKKNKTLVKELK